MRLISFILMFALALIIVMKDYALIPTQVFINTSTNAFQFSADSEDVEKDNDVCHNGNQYQPLFQLPYTSIHASTVLTRGEFDAHVGLMDIPPEI